MLYSLTKTEANIGIIYKTKTTLEIKTAGLKRTKMKAKIICRTKISRNIH